PVGVDQHRRFGGVPIPKIVRSELVIPAELSGLGVERQDAVGVQVVAQPVVAVVFGGGISGRPVEYARLRIVRAGEPGGRARMLDALALPAIGNRLARLGDSPEFPGFLTRGLVVGGQESARAVLAAADSGDHQVSDGQRSGGREIALLRIGGLYVPDLFTS